MMDETRCAGDSARPSSLDPIPHAPDGPGTGSVRLDPSTRALRSRRRSRPSTSARPAADPLHWWRTRGAEGFDDLDLRVLVLLLNRYSLSRYAWWAALSGSSTEAICLLARRGFAPGDRDLLMTCLLRSALAGDTGARQFLIQALRRRGLNDLATSWRLVRQGPRRLALRRRKTAARYRRRIARDPKTKAGCGNRGQVPSAP
jgi:hypothetical protein